MKIYLSIKSIPEFQGLPHAQRLKKYRLYYIKSFGHWGQWIGLSLAVFFIYAGMWLADVAFPRFLGIQFSGIGDFIFTIFFILLGAITYQVCVLGTIAYLAKGEY